MRRLAPALAVLLLAGAAVIGWELYGPYKGYPEGKLLIIPPGLRAPQVAQLLAERGILAHRWPLLACYWLGRWRHRRIKAGEYLFDRPLRPVDVYRKLIQGDVHLHAVVIPEGSDRFDIAHILAQQIGMDRQEFLRVTEQSDLVRDLDPRARTLEGYLFPDTYRFARGVAPRTAIAAMVGRFRQVMGVKLEPDVGRSLRDLHEVITLASLVEKETPDPRERPIIAGVFARRLKKGWALDCDPTVAYAARLAHPLVEHAPEPITQNDLRFSSPYNTYRHAGLPPGPICNPGEASIRAALDPLDDRFLYFVSNNHGGHLFARTLAEHQRNVARYRRQAAELRRAAPDGIGHTEQPPAKEHQSGNRGLKTPANRAKHQKQKTTHSRLHADQEARARRSARDPGH